MRNKPEIINELKKALEFYGELGFEYLPLRNENLKVSFPDIPHCLKENHDDPGEQGTESVDDDQNKEESLQKLKEHIGDCQRCKLSANRKNIVFGEGSPDAEIMFIGEGPGRDEDIQARPFVGDAGKLLTNLILKLGLKREDVYIANIVKCRPPNNRNPEEDEIRTCRRFVENQIDIIKPRVIVCLGKVSANALLALNMPIGRLRGNFYSMNGIPIMPTFHPAYLLRNPKDKWLTWDDMQKVMEKLK